MLNDRERKGRTRFHVSDQHGDDARQQRVSHRDRHPRTIKTPDPKSVEKTEMNAVLEKPQAVEPTLQAIPTHPMVLQDGVTHINIDAYAKTELGRMLVHKFSARFEHPTFGRFKSVEGFWGFIRDGARDDRWRYVSGMTAKRETRNLGSRYVANFHQIIMEANFFKVSQNEAIKELMMASTLPFEHYYIYRSEEMTPDNPGVPTRPQIASWLTRGFEDIRKMLLNGTRPEKPDYSDVYFTPGESSDSETTDTSDS